jgi:hypothetical protein
LLEEIENYGSLPATPLELEETPLGNRAGLKSPKPTTEQLKRSQDPRNADSSIHNIPKPPQRQQHDLRNFLDDSRGDIDAHNYNSRDLRNYQSKDSLLTNLNHMLGLGGNLPSELENTSPRERATPYLAGKDSSSLEFGDFDADSQQPRELDP